MASAPRPTAFTGPGTITEIAPSAGSPPNQPARQNRAAGAFAAGQHCNGKGLKRMKYASRSSGFTGAQTPKGNARLDPVSTNDKRSPGFNKTEDRSGPPGPTLRKGAETAVTTQPKLLDNRPLQARDNSGGLLIPLSHARHTLGRDPAQGGVRSFMTDAGKSTSQRKNLPQNDQFPQPEMQKQQIQAQPGPGKKVGTEGPKVKRGALFPCDGP